MSAFAIYQELKVDALKRNIVNYLQQLCAIEGTEEHQIYKSDVQRVDFNYAAELCFEDLVMLTRNQQFKSWYIIVIKYLLQFSLVKCIDQVRKISVL